MSFWPAVDNVAVLKCCSSVCLLATAVFRNELLRPLMGLSGFGSPLRSSSRSQPRSTELVFHGPPFTLFSTPLHTLPGLQGRSGSIEADEAEDLGSVEFWGTSHRGFSLLASQPSGTPLLKGWSHWGATREEDGWVVTVCSNGANGSTWCLRESGSSEAMRSKEFLCVEERRVEDKAANGVEIMGGSKVRDLSSMSIIVWPVESEDCWFERWVLLTSTPFLVSKHWELALPRLCLEDTGLENKESNSWKSFTSIVVL